MGKRPTGEMIVEADGKEWTLVADFNAMCDFEELAGISAVTFLGSVEAGEDVSAIQLRHFVLCCMKQRHEDATPRDAGRVMSANPTALYEAVAAAFPDAVPDADGEAAPGEA